MAFFSVTPQFTPPCTSLFTSSPSPINRSLSGTFPPRSLCSLWRRFLRGSVDRGGFRMYRICQFDCLINNNQQVTAAWVFLNLQPRTGLPKSSAEWLTKAGRAGNRQVCRPAPYKCLLPAGEFLRSRDKREIGLTGISVYVARKQVVVNRVFKYFLKCQFLYI